MNYTKYTTQEIKQLSKETLWNNSIKNIQSIPNTEDNKKKYILYATGEADLINGRKYICLPSNKILTSHEKEKYNIL